MANRKTKNKHAHIFLRMELAFVNLFYGRSKTLLCFLSKNSFLLASSLMLFQHHNIIEYIVFLNELERVLKLKLNKSLKQKSTVCNNYTNFQIVCTVWLCLKTFVCNVILENYIYVFAKYCFLITNTTKHQNIVLDHLITI